MFYLYELKKDENTSSFIYDFDSNLIKNPVYLEDSTKILFESEEVIPGLEPITEEERNSIIESSIVEEVVIEEKPSEIEELRNQVVSLEQALMFLLGGGE